MEALHLLFLITIVYCNPYTNDDSNSHEDNIQDDTDLKTEIHRFQNLPLSGPIYKVWQIRTLEYINDLRYKGNLPPLRMSENLTNDVQLWAEKVACRRPQYREDIRGKRARRFKIDLSTKYIHPNSRSKTVLLRKAINKWFKLSRYFDCNEPITLEDVYSGADNFQKVGPYTVIMGRQYEEVGFAVATCPESDSVLIFARFNYNRRRYNRIINQELERQYIAFVDRDYLDVSKLVACPDEF